MLSSAMNIRILADAKTANAEIGKLRSNIMGLSADQKRANVLSVQQEKALATQSRAIQQQRLAAQQTALAREAVAVKKRMQLAAQAAASEEQAQLRSMKRAQAETVARTRAAFATVKADMKAIEAKRVRAAQEELASRRSELNAARQAKTDATNNAAAERRLVAAAKRAVTNIRADNALAASARKRATEESLAAMSSARARETSAAKIVAANAAIIASDRKVAAEGAASRLLSATPKQRGGFATASNKATAAAEAAAVTAANEAAFAKQVALSEKSAAASERLAMRRIEDDMKMAASRRMRAAQEEVATRESILQNTLEASSSRDMAVIKAEAALKAAQANVTQIASDTKAAAAARESAFAQATAAKTTGTARAIAAQETVVSNAAKIASDERMAAAAAAAHLTDARTAESAANAEVVAANREIAALNRVATAHAATSAKTVAANSASAASMATMGNNLTKAGSRMQWIGRQMMTNLTMPFAIVAGLGVKFGLDMEKSMTRLTKVYGDAALNASLGAKGMNEEITALRENFIALSNVYGVQADEVANVAADWSAAGSSGAALAKQTELTMRTMVLGEMDATDATEALIAIQAQWGAVSSNNVDELIKQGKSTVGVTEDSISLTGILRDLNAVENETGAKMSDLVQAFSRASGAARTAGVDTKHLAAMTAALVPAAGSANEAGNALKSMLIGILNPTAETRDVLGAMGIAMEGAGWQSLNAAQRMETMVDSFSHLTSGQKAVVSRLVATKWQVNKFSVLMEALKNETGYYNRSLKLLADRSEVARIAQKELQTVLESSPQRAKQAGVIIQNSLMKMMEPLIPVIIQLALWIGKLFQTFADIDPKVRTVILALFAFLAVVGPVIVAMAVMKLAVGQLIPLFAFLGRMILLPLLPLRLLTIAFWTSGAGAKIAARAYAVVGAAARLFGAVMYGVAALAAPVWAFMAASVAAGGKAMIAAWRTTHSVMLAIQAGWRAATTGIMMLTSVGLIIILEAWAAAMKLIQGAWAVASVAAYGLWSAIMLAFQRGWAAASIALAITWKGVQLAATKAWAVADIAIRKAWATVTLFMSGAFWRMMFTTFAMGGKGLLNIVKMGGRALIAVFASPWAIVIGIVVGLLFVFRRQIADAFNKIKAYFHNLPASAAQAMSPFSKLFVNIKNAVLRAFNALPGGVKNAIVAVVHILGAAVAKIREFFSYINPFARHSPSLVDNVKGGMAVIADEFSKAADVAEANVGRMKNSIAELERGSSGLTAKNTADKRAAFYEDTQRIGEGSQAVPAYFDIAEQVDAGRASLKGLEDQLDVYEAKARRAAQATQVHEDRIEAIADKTAEYDRAIADLNDRLDILKERQDAVGKQLDKAKASYDRFSNAQIAGSQAAEDATFANTMAQKALQLQIAKLSKESGADLDKMKDKYAALQGEIENLMARRSELQQGGAGSDILAEYDKMIADLKSQQGGLLGDGATGPAAEVEALNKKLQELQSQAEIMDLEKSLKFDPLNHQLDKLRSNVEEMPFDTIVSGMNSSKASVDSLQVSYDSLGMAIEAQQGQIDTLEKKKKDLAALNRDEEAAIAAIKNANKDNSLALRDAKARYDEINESVREGEQAMSDYEQAVGDAIQRLDELERAKKEKAGGSEGEISPGLQNFLDAGAGDFEIPGGDATLGREGGTGSQVGDIEAMTADLQKELESSLGGLNPFEGLKKWWNKTKDWFKANMGGFGAMFGDLSNIISGAFGGGDGPNVFERLGNSLSGFWNVLKTVGKFLWNLFGPDLMSTFKELADGFTSLWAQNVGPLKELATTLWDFVQTLAVQLAPTVVMILATLEVLWEILNGAIGPVFNWIGGIIHAVILIITGAIKILSGAMKIIQGVMMVLIGFLKGLFTMDWSMFLAGFAKIWEGLKNMGDGILDIFQGIWTAIWTTIKNFAILIWNTVWGFVKGIIDFFKELWDTLVGHSIIPDMINAIIDWFMKLPGTVLGLVWDLVTNIIKFFVGLPWKILEALGDLGMVLFGWAKGALDWVVGHLPGAIVDFLQFYFSLPGKIIAALGSIGSLGGKLWEFTKGAFRFAIDKGPEIVKLLYGLAKDIIEGLLKGLKDKLGDVGNFFAHDLPDKIKNTFKSALGIGSPSKEFDEYGQNIGEGLEQGIEAKGPEVHGAVEGLGKQILSVTLPAVPMNEVFKDFVESTDNASDRLKILTDGLAKFRTETESGVGLATADAIQQINDTMRDTPAALEGFDQSMIQANGFINTVTESGSSMHTQMKDVQTAFDTAGAAAFQYAIDSGKSTQEAAGAAAWAAAQIREQFIQQAIDAGIPMEKAQALATAYGLVGKDIYTKFNVDLNQADIDVNAFQNKQRTITFEVSLKNSIQQHPEALNFFGNMTGVATMAVGGWIEGPGTPTSDSVLTFTSRGEFIVNAKQAARYGDLLEQINDGTYNASANASVGFADGGTVGDSINSAGKIPLDANLKEVTEAAKKVWDEYAAYMTAATDEYVTAQTTLWSGFSGSMIATLNGMYAQMILSTQTFATNAPPIMQAYSDSNIAIVTDMALKIHEVLTALFTSLNEMFNLNSISLQSIWTAFAVALQATVDTTIKPMFDSFKPMLEQLEQWFTDTVTNIGKIWEGIKEPVAAPSRFIVNEVYNKGIKEAWNKVNTFLGLPPLDAYTVAFASGGAAKGRGTGTSDSIPARLSNNEHVVTAKEVAGAGGHREVERVRSMWRHGVSPGMDGVAKFAQGGAVVFGHPTGGIEVTPQQQSMWDAVKTAFPNATLNSGLRHADVGAGFDYHMRGMAVDLGGPREQIADWINATYRAQTLELILGDGYQHNLWHGEPHQYSAATLADHGGSNAHTHWAAAGPVTSDGKIISMAGAGMAAMSYVQQVEEAWKSVMDPIRATVPKGGDSSVSKMPELGFNKFHDEVKKFLIGKATEKDKAILSAGSIPGAGVERWRGVVGEVLAKMGLPLDWAELTLAQMQTESGGNPQAINLTDSNAQKGTPSKGLMQVIDPTFASMYSQFGPRTGYPNDIWNPYSNIAAGLSWVVTSRGSPVGVWGQGHGYDQGGLLEPGWNYNGMTTPEPVLTGNQWDGMYRIADGVSGFGSGTVAAGVITGMRTLYGETPVQTAIETTATGTAQANAEWTPLLYNVAEGQKQESGRTAKQAERVKTQMDKAQETAEKAKQFLAKISEIGLATGVLIEGIGKAWLVKDDQNTDRVVDAVDGVKDAVNKGNGIAEDTTPGGGPGLTSDNWMDYINFKTLAPLGLAIAGLIEMLPEAKPEYVSWAGTNQEVTEEMKRKKTLNDVANIAKGMYNVTRNLAPPLIKHAFAIGGAIERLAIEDGAAWAQAIGMLSMGNPLGALILIPIILKEIFTLLPLILDAIMDIVPILIKSLIMFITQFMPDSVYAYDTYEAANEAATKHEDDIRKGASGPNYQTPVQNVNQNETINIHVYQVDVNADSPDSADEFILNLQSLA